MAAVQTAMMWVFVFGGTGWVARRWCCYGGFASNDYVAGEEVQYSVAASGWQVMNTKCVP